MAASEQPADRPGATMQDYVVHALTVFMGFFAIMNPITNTTIFKVSSTRPSRR
jgi:hypothetical protein